MSQPARLIVALGSAREIPLGDEPFLIGRSNECHLVLEGNGNASRKHAQIRRSGAQWLITDLGSGNGTLVNGQRVTECPLLSGDSVSVGGVEMRFVLGGAPAPAHAPASPSPPPRPTAPAPSPPAVPNAYPAHPHPVPSEPGTEAVDMGRVLQGGSLETAAFDTPSAVADTGEFAGGLPVKKNVAIALGVAGVFLAGLGWMFFVNREPPRAPGPTLEPYARIQCYVNDYAYLTLEHQSVRPRDPTIARATSKADGTNEIAVLGLKPGKTVIEVLVDRDRGWAIDVLVKEKEAWPPGWTQDDRLGAAEQLKREADGMYRGIQGNVAAMVAVYHMCRKILHLYENCEFFPPEPHQLAEERALELETQIKAKEKEALTEFRRLYRTGNWEGAESQINELLSIFPEDGSDENLLRVHGDSKKYRQYFLLREKLRESRRQGRK